MAETGKVVKVIGDEIEIEIVRLEACSGCHGCDVGKKEHMNLIAKNLCKAKEGDIVKIDIANRDFLGATFILYGIPLIMLVSGFFIGYYTADNVGLNKDLVGFFTGIILLLLSYKWIRSKEELWKAKNFKAIAFEII